MNTITRSEKLEHAEGSLTEQTGFYLHAGVVNKTLELPGNDIPLHALESGVSSNTRVADFNTWLHKDPHARDLSEGGATLKQALPAYRTAIRHKLAKMKEWQPEVDESLNHTIQELAEAGHIPKVLAERLEERHNAAAVDIKIADSSTGEETAAFYTPDTHVVYLRPWLSRKAFASTMIHEAFHGLSGMSAKSSGDKLFTSRLGLGTQIVGEKGYVGPNITNHRAINEGVTEYLRNLVMYGQPGDISPDRRGPENDTKSYPVEREIVQILADRVGLDVLLNAYADDYEPGVAGTYKHTRELMHQIRKAYGPGFLNKLDKLDQGEGPERALAFMKAADYVAGNRDRAKTIGQKAGAVLGLNDLRP